MSAPEAQRLVATEDKRGIAELFIKAFGDGLSEAYCNAIRRQFEHLNAGEMAQMARQCAEVEAGVDLKEIIPLEHITARMMIVNGADDPLICEADNARIRRELPRAEFRVIPSVGHSLHVRQAAIVGDYLSARPHCGWRQQHHALPRREPMMDHGVDVRLGGAVARGMP